MMAATKKPASPRNRRIVGIVRAAKYAGVSRWTVRAWIQDKRLRWIRYPSKGGGWRTMIDLNDLDKFIAGLYNEAVEPEEAPHEQQAAARD